MSLNGIELRKKLVELALEWQKEFGVAPGILSSISEFDAAMLLGMKEIDYSNFMQTITAVNKGFDFKYNGLRYQIKANRPSGKPGSTVTNVRKARNYDFDILIWILYNTEFQMVEAWSWNVKDYVTAFDSKETLRPEDMQRGKLLFTNSNLQVISTKTVHKNSKDTKQYTFEGLGKYVGKCSFPYEVVKYYVEKNKNITFTDLKRAFPDGIEMSGTPVFIQKLENVSKKDLIDGRVKDINNPIILSSGEKIVVSNQYNPTRIDYFNKVAQKLGFKVSWREK